MNETPATSTLTFPSEADYANRVARARTAIKQDGIDVLAPSSFDNHRFFAGLDGIASVRPVWFVLPQDGEAAFVSLRIFEHLYRLRGRRGTKSPMSAKREFTAFAAFANNTAFPP
jgi:hypothetical protein